MPALRFLGRRRARREQQDRERLRRVARGERPPTISRGNWIRHTIVVGGLVVVLAVYLWLVPIARPWE